MKEFGFTLGPEILRRGIRRDWRAPKNSIGLTDLYNLIPFGEGLAQYQQLIMPWSEGQLHTIGIQLSWPFPQLVKLKSFTLLLGSDYIFSVDENDWSLTQLETYDFYNKSQTKAITSGLRWQAMDFWDTWIMTNGYCTLYYDRFDDKVLVEDSVGITAVADYKGRGVFGGFSQGRYWSTAWQNYWTSNPSSIIGDTPRALDVNWIKWTMVGGGDLKTIFDASFDKMDLERNDSGEMPMAQKSLVVKIKQLGERLVVYSYQDASVVSHKSAPTSTLAIDEWRIGPGVYNSDAIDGDGFNHIYVSNDLELWWINRQFRAIRLGFKELLSEMRMSGDLVVSFRESDGSFFISNGSFSLVLTWDRDKDRPLGMAKVKHVVTSIINSVGTDYHLGSDPRRDDELIKAGFTTDVFDLNRPGIKRITWLEFHGSEGVGDGSGDSIQFRVYYRYSKNDSFAVTGWRSVSKEGACYFPIEGVDFKVEMRADDFELISNFSRIHIAFQISDNRYKRGIDVSEINSSAG